ncbi:MAG: class I SAM-dependent methyltransferase [Egibacteraceae bacterium]
MPRPDAPFIDPTIVRGQLYATPDRLARRTGALHRAKVAGRHAAQVVAELAVNALPPQHALAAVDVGCGRGTTTQALVDQLGPAELIAVDISPVVLAAARARLAGHGPVRFVCADFHSLPLRDASCHLVVAAFCLYHSSQPAAVMAEFARCLAPGGAAILVTKSADSYHELDQLMATSGLDPQAPMRPSLYATAHSGNLPEMAATALDVRRVVHEPHRFRFADLAHAAGYLATNPKYVLPEQLRADPATLATALRTRLPDHPVTATSTVTFVVATRPPGHGQVGRLA